MAEYPDELACDLAETYGVFDYVKLPLITVATLVCGLGDNSRIKRKMSDIRYTTEELLLAMACDRLGMLLWINTKDGQRGKNKPGSILSEMLKKDTRDKVKAFKSPDAFNTEWERITSA